MQTKQLAGSALLATAGMLALCLGARAATGALTSNGQTVYLPVESHVYHGDQMRAFNLSATVNIRNTDTKSGLTILAVDYYDSDGKFVKGFLDRAKRLNPLSSAQYFIAESDTSGGSGASFIVKWRSEKEINSPIVEGIMIGTRSGQGISWVARGQILQGDGQ